MTPDPAPDADPAALRAEVAHLRRVNQELIATVAGLRATVGSPALGHEFLPQHVADLARSGITPAQAFEAGFRSVTDMRKSCVVLGLPDPKYPGCTSCPSG